MNRYFQEVLDAHLLISRWLGEASAPQDVCETLLGRFSPAFTMVGLSGNRLDNAGLSAFFRTQGGAKAGLEIGIENMQLVAEGATGAIVTYHERQQLPGQSATLRYSTVVYELGEGGRVMWRHLHETAAA